MMSFIRETIKTVLHTKKIDRLLQRCDEAQLNVILATAEAIIGTSDEPQHD